MCRHKTDPTIIVEIGVGAGLVPAPNKNKNNIYLGGRKARPYKLKQFVVISYYIKR